MRRCEPYLKIFFYIFVHGRLASIKHYRLRLRLSFHEMSGFVGSLLSELLAKHARERHFLSSFGLFGKIYCNLDARKRWASKYIATRIHIADKHTSKHNTIVQPKDIIRNTYKERNTYALFCPWNSSPFPTLLFLSRSVSLSLICYNKSVSYYCFFVIHVQFYSVRSERSWIRERFITL